MNYLNLHFSTVNAQILETIVNDAKSLEHPICSTFKDFAMGQQKVDILRLKSFMRSLGETKIVI